MTSSAYERVASWRRRQAADLRLQYRNECWYCGSADSLEFAHRHGMETLRGAGRGSSERIGDIRRNPLNYLLLCRDCHLAYDSQMQDETQDPEHTEAELEAVLTAFGFRRECQ